MTRICWWLVEMLSCTLDPDEWEAVRGDFEECGEAGGQVLLGLLGLVVRRQATLWKDWRPWLALVGLVGPVGLLISISSAGLYSIYETYLWIIRNYRDIDPAILEDIGMSVRHGIMVMACSSLLLVAWSWTSGFVLASLSRRTIRVNGGLFCLVLLLGELLLIPLNPRHHEDVQGWQVLYREISPLLLRGILVLLPAIWGMHQGLRLATRPMVQAFLSVATIVTALTVRSWFGAPSGANWQVNVLLLAVYWPVGYMLASASWRCWKENHT